MQSLFLMTLGEHIVMTEYNVILSEQTSKDMTDIYEYVINPISSPLTAMN